jgi:hypothetical protein
MLDATLEDQTGQLRLRWLGRSEIPGVTLGTRLVVAGTVASVHGLAVVLNPSYRSGGSSSSSGTTSW